MAEWFKISFNVRSINEMDLHDLVLQLNLISRRGCQSPDWRLLPLFALFGTFPFIMSMFENFLEEHTT